MSVMGLFMIEAGCFWGFIFMVSWWSRLLPKSCSSVIDQTREMQSGTAAFRNMKQIRTQPDQKTKINRRIYLSNLQTERNCLKSRASFVGSIDSFAFSEGNSSPNFHSEPDAAVGEKSTQRWWWLIYRRTFWVAQKASIATNSKGNIGILVFFDLSKTVFLLNVDN